MALEQRISLDARVGALVTTDDQVALGDLEIRKTFARSVIGLFVVANVLVLIGLGAVFSVDCLQIAAKQIAPDQRIVNSSVIIALLGATTVQLGAVVLTIARAIFPGAAMRAASGPPGRSRRRGGGADNSLDVADPPNG